MRTIYSVIFNNLFLKTISLFLAVLTWSYIAGQLYSQVPEAQQSSQAVVALSDKNVIVKTVPVHINLIGTPDKRFRVAMDRIRVYPAECVISGPPETIETVSAVTTEPISVEGVVKTVKRYIRLKGASGVTINKDQDFYVVVPVAKKRSQ